MPRAFDSDAQHHPDAGPLAYTENVDCPACGATFDGLFTAGPGTVDDLDTPPEGAHSCPGCGHRFTTTLTGWTHTTEAG